MRFSRVPALMLFVLVAVLGSSSPARAWTRTVVKGARATVDVEPDATLSILLRLDVEVHAGWLHEMELAGLPPRGGVRARVGVMDARPKDARPLVRVVPRVGV